MDELKKNGINTDNIPDIQSKISLLGQAILKLKNKKLMKIVYLYPTHYPSLLLSIT